MVVLPPQWLLVLLLYQCLQKVRELGTDAAFDCIKHSAIEFAAEYSIDVPDFTAPYNHRGTGRRSIKLNSRLQGYTVDAFVESGVGDRTFDAHYKRLSFEVIDALVADFEGRFIETACEIIEAMASLNPVNSFANYSKASIDKLGRHYCDDFNDTERGMLSTEVELMITEITMVKKATELSEMKMNDMCKWLHTKSGSYLHTQCLYVLVSVLPYSSAACERNFSGLKFVKNRLRSTIGDNFLDDLLTMLVENDLVVLFSKQMTPSDTSFTQAINYFAMHTVWEEKGKDVIH